MAESVCCQICESICEGITPILPKLTKLQIYGITIRDAVQNCPVYKMLWLGGHWDKCYIAGFHATIHGRICTLEMREMAEKGGDYEVYNIPYIPPTPKAIREAKKRGK